MNARSTCRFFLSSHADGGLENRIKEITSGRIEKIVIAKPATVALVLETVPCQLGVSSKSPVGSTNLSAVDDGSMRLPSITSRSAFGVWAMASRRFAVQLPLISGDHGARRAVGVREGLKQDEGCAARRIPY
jgi:hypothetical protein